MRSGYMAIMLTTTALVEIAMGQSAHPLPSPPSRSAGLSAHPLPSLHPTPTTLGSGRALASIPSTKSHSGRSSPEAHANGISMHKSADGTPMTHNRKATTLTDASATLTNSSSPTPINSSAPINTTSVAGCTHMCRRREIRALSETERHTYWNVSHRDVMISISPFSQLIIFVCMGLIGHQEAQ